MKKITHYLANENILAVTLTFAVVLLIILIKQNENKTIDNRITKSLLIEETSNNTMYNYNALADSE